MRAVCQRVAEARVVVAGEVAGEIGAGLCVLLGVARGDGPDESARLAGKVARLRVFEDEAGRFDRSLLDVGGAALVVSQFTLIADSTRPTDPVGSKRKRSSANRPSFTDAAPPEQAEPLYERLCEELHALGVSVETGVFGARMRLELVNDGPVTILEEAFAKFADDRRYVASEYVEFAGDPFIAPVRYVNELFAARGISYRFDEDGKAEWHGDEGAYREVVAPPSPPSIATTSRPRATSSRPRSGTCARERRRTRKTRSRKPRRRSSR